MIFSLCVTLEGMGLESLVSFGHSQFKKKVVKMVRVQKRSTKLLKGLGECL